MVGFAERGEQILNAPVRDQATFNSTNAYFTDNFSPASTGQYQLEIRRISPTVITDTNQRSSASTTLVMPTGAVIDAAANKVFTISDGRHLSALNSQQPIP